MKLYLARHGQTEWNRLGYYSGQLDEPMNETGRRQIEALARPMAGGCRSNLVEPAFQGGPDGGDSAGRP